MNGNPQDLTLEQLNNLSEEEIQIEFEKCNKSALYFIVNYVKIYDNIEQSWIPFELWEAQDKVLEEFFIHLWLVILKARQLGLTWLCLGYGLWMILFRPISIVLLFSKRDDEARYLLSDQRLKGMYKRLPRWLQAKSIARDSSHEFRLSNGSSVFAFPTTAGDSYTATLVIVDEADLVPDLDALLRSVKPTIDAGKQIILLSRSDKDNPRSAFKNIYRNAKLKKNKWFPIFLPWNSRPDRTEQWYREQREDIIARTGYLDSLYEQYPATDTEALAGSTENKRIPPLWLERCYDEWDPIYEEDLPAEFPSIPQVRVYKLPEMGHIYKTGVDTAEGNPTSNDSAVNIIDGETGEQVAIAYGKWEPQITADYANQLSEFYNFAEMLVERNHHGGTALAWLEVNATCPVLEGPDDKPGWLSNRPGKVSLYDDTASGAKAQEFLIHDKDTYEQLKSIEGNTLKAPQHEPDDKADSFSLAFKAILLNNKSTTMTTGRVIWKYLTGQKTDSRSRNSMPHRLSGRGKKKFRSWAK